LFWIFYPDSTNVNQDEFIQDVPSNEIISPLVGIIILTSSSSDSCSYMGTCWFSQRFVVPLNQRKSLFETILRLTSVAPFNEKLVASSGPFTQSYWVASYFKTWLFCKGIPPRCTSVSPLKYSGFVSSSTWIRISWLSTSSLSWSFQKIILILIISHLFKKKLGEWLKVTQWIDRVNRSVSAPISSHINIQQFPPWWIGCQTIPTFPFVFLVFLVFLFFVYRRFFQVFIRVQFFGYLRIGVDSIWNTSCKSFHTGGHFNLISWW